jgi:hypothetical protein
VFSSYREGACFYGSRKFKTRHRGDGCYAWKDMRGNDIQQNALFSYGSLNERVPEKHPLRAIVNFHRLTGGHAGRSEKRVPSSAVANSRSAGFLVPHFSGLRICQDLGYSTFIMDHSAGAHFTS